MLPHDFAFTAAVPGGQSWTFPLKTLRRGTIERLRVVQVDGPADGAHEATRSGFAYAVFNTADVGVPIVNGQLSSVRYAGAPGVLVPGTLTTPAAGCIPEIHQVSPLLAVAAGQSSYQSAEGFPEDGVSNLHLPYGCLDAFINGVYVPRRASPTWQAQYLFLRIDCLGTGLLRTFGIGLSILSGIH